MSYTYEHPMHAVTADVVVVDTWRTVPHILLIKRGREPYAGRWALPGGFVEPGEPTEIAARRELREETGLLSTAELDLVGVFDAPGRDPRGHVISVAYLAVLQTLAQKPKAGDDAADVCWFPVLHLPDLAFDHDAIIMAAMEKL